jgi:hypothetical protein
VIEINARFAHAGVACAFRKQSAFRVIG